MFDGDAFNLATYNLTIISKTILLQRFLPAFSYTPLQAIKVGMTLDGKAKIKAPLWSFGML